MKIIIAGGTGFIGQALVHCWTSQGREIVIIGRSTEKIKKIFSDKVTAMAWKNLDTTFVKACADADAIINLTGANIGSFPWTKHRREIIISSRVNATRKLAELCAKLGTESPPLFNASAIGVYGLQNTDRDGPPPPVDENTKIDFNNYPDFLAEVGRKWEAATQPAIDKGVRVTWMRFGVVLAKQGGVLPRLSLPIKLFVGGKIGSGQQPFTWIALTDLVRAIDFLLHLPEFSGPINLVAPQCVTQAQLTKTLAKILHRPAAIPASAFILKLVLGQMADELLIRGQNVCPTKLKELNFNFTYPTLELALEGIFKTH